MGLARLNPISVRALIIEVLYIPQLLYFEEAATPLTNQPGRGSVSSLQYVTCCTGGMSALLRFSGATLKKHPLGQL